MPGTGDGLLTAAVPAFLILVGWWENSTTTAVVVAVLGVLVIAAGGPLTRSGSAQPAAAPASPGTATGVR